MRDPIEYKLSFLLFIPLLTDIFDISRIFQGSFSTTLRVQWRASKISFSSVDVDILYMIAWVVKPVRLVSAVCNFDRPGSGEYARL